MSLIKLSNGVEISEDTIVAALQKAGIETNLSEPQHIFEAGDVAKKLNSIFHNNWRFIVRFREELHSFDSKGLYMSTGQDRFELENYKFIGRQSDLLKK